MTRILVVEDNTVDAEQLRRLLEDAGFETDVCFESNAALSLFSSTAHDLVISNINMPGPSGYDVSRRVKTTALAERNIPVFLLTPKGAPIDVYQGLRCGADQFMTKPYDPEELLARVRSALSRREVDPGMGEAIQFLGRTFETNAEKERVLNVLLAAFDDHVKTRDQLDVCRVELEASKQETRTLLEDLEQRVQESVTERMQRNEILFQSQKMEALGDLASGLAHDFNNMLTVVVGNLDTISGEVRGNARAGKLCSNALEAAVRGAELTRQLLAFSRKQPLTPAVSDVNEIVASMLQTLTPTLGDNVKLEVSADPTLWPAMIDQAQFQVAIANLTKNAVEAMPQGGKISIETRNVIVDERFASGHIGMSAGDFALICVTDTGTGIPGEILPRVFEPLFSTRSATGLGLSMVFGFVRQSEGHVRIESRDGQGTTVRLYLPRAKAEGLTLTTGRANKTARPPSGNETILVVEDDHNVRRTIIQQLRQLGYRVLEADRASAALAILDRNDAIDLLFTDIIMPGGMSGRDLGRKASLLRPALKTLYTSGYMRGLRDDHRLEPTDVFIGKPFRLHELAHKVREALGQQSPKSAAKGG